MHLDLHATDEELQRIAKAEQRTDRIKNSVLITILVVITGGVGYWAYDAHVQQVRLDTQGIRTVGRLEHEITKVTRSKTGEIRYEVDYWFDIGANKYTGTAMVRYRPEIYQEVNIIYDPINPNNNKLEGSDPFPSHFIESMVIVGVLYLCSGASYLYRKFKRRKQRKQFVPGIH